jgi:DNA-binding NarL/FixJ family response regulator
MPNVHGIEIGRCLWARPRDDAALIAHTALDALEIRDEAIAAGFDAFVGKPTAPADLAAAINSVCTDALEWAAEHRLASACTSLHLRRPLR